MRLAFVTGFAFAALAFASPPALAQQAQNAPADFDYYVFALSWSPGYCDTGGADKAPRQCATGAALGFVVHGLWPNRSFARSPENCRTDVAIPAEALRLADGVYPDEGLARYEYRRHGTCTGLEPAAYFAAAKTLRDSIVVPDALKAPREKFSLSPDDLQRAFLAANPNLRAENMAIVCRNGELVGVRVCVAKDLGAFVNCPKVAGHTCHAASIAVAPLR